MRVLDVASSQDFPNSEEVGIVGEYGISVEWGVYSMYPNGVIEAGSITPFESVSCAEG